MDGAAEVLGVAHAPHRGLADDVTATLGERAVWIGKQRAVLFGQEEAGGNGIDTDVGRELLRHFRRHIYD